MLVVSSIRLVQLRCIGGVTVRPIQIWPSRYARNQSKSIHKRKAKLSYIDNNLMNGEEVIYRAKLHWIVFFWPVVILAAAIISFSGGGADVGMGVSLLLVSMILGLLSFINYKTSEFGVTNKRVIAKFGFIRRNSLEVLLNKVEGVQVNQGIVGRILGYGSVAVSGTGGTRDPFPRISDPLKLRMRVQEQISSM